MITGDVRLDPPGGAPDGPLFDEDDLWRMDEDPATIMTALWRRHGDIFTIHRAAARPRVVLTTAEHIRELARRDPDLRSCGTSQFAQLVGEHSLNMLDGESHRLMRQLLLPPLNARALSGRVQRIRALVREELDRLDAGRPVPLITFTSKIALRVITSVLFSAAGETEANDACDALLGIIDGIHRYRAIAPARRTGELTAAMRADFREQLARLDRHVYALIANYRSHSAPDRADLLGHLIAAPAELTDQQIRDQLVTMIVAGYLTTASGLAMAAYWLHRPGGHADETIAELDTLAADASAADLAALQHLAAFCDETLRMGSIVPHSAGRRTSSALTGFGHRLPAETELIVSIYLAHRRAEVYPEPDVFRPQRFIDAPPRANEFVPFGQGTRRCPGAALTTLEMKIFLAELRRTPGVELLGADIPFHLVSLGSTLAPPAQLRIRRAGARSQDSQCE